IFWRSRRRQEADSLEYHKCSASSPRRLQRSPNKLLRRDTGIMAAKAERVTDDTIHFHLAGCIRHVVQIALGIGDDLIDGRRNGVSFDGLCTNGHLDRAGRAEHMTGRAFGRTDRQFSGVLAEDRLDSLSFSNIALWGRSAMRVDIGNVFRVEAAV